MITENKKNELMLFISKLKAAGFVVLVPVKMTTYCHFAKDDKIGYVERGDFGFNFSTVHKPCKECGTGFSISRDANATIELAKDCLVLTPNWAYCYLKYVKKYKNIKEYNDSAYGAKIEI